MVLFHFKVFYPCPKLKLLIDSCLHAYYLQRGKSLRLIVNKSKGDPNTLSWKIITLEYFNRIKKIWLNLKNLNHQRLLSSRC